MIADALREVGARPQTLCSRALAAADAGPALIPRLPVEAWGRPSNAGVRFYAQRAVSWTVAAREILSTARRTQPQVVHFQMPINRRLDVHLIRLLRRSSPVVWTAHDVLPFEATDRDRERFAAIYSAVDRVIVHTHPAAAEVRSLAEVEAAVIEHPVTTAKSLVEKQEARRRLGLKPDGRLLAALGFIRPYKGYALLADTWERLGDHGPSLLVMGELMAEEERPVLDRLARATRADVRLGYASDEDIWLAICAADALLLPYVTASDSGILHLGRAAGVPVIASDAPQLAASVMAVAAGVVVPRNAGAWSAAVTGDLPAAPAAPPSSDRVGMAHLKAYREALATTPNL